MFLVSGIVTTKCKHFTIAGQPRSPRVPPRWQSSISAERRNTLAATANSQPAGSTSLTIARTDYDGRHVGARASTAKHALVALIGVEFLIGTAVVIGHNVLRVLPNEVPILVVLSLVSLRLRNGEWKALGFKRPVPWLGVGLIALAAAGLRIVAADFLIDPVTQQFWPPQNLPAHAETITGNPGAAALALVFVWTFAAFGEEIGYRGYLLARAAEFGGGSNLAYWLAVIPVSVLFGFGHYYKGPAGIVDSGLAGFILGAAYLLSGRYLWTAILAHGLIDTVAVVILYFGWQT